EMLEHYDTAALPTRPKKPRDKAKVENGVQIVERWVLARLRKLTFFSLPDLNAVIFQLLDVLNHKPFKKLPGSRHSQFEALERPALKLSVPKMSSEIFKPEFQVDEFNFDTSFCNWDNSASQSFGQGR